LQKAGEGGGKIEKYQKKCSLTHKNEESKKPLSDVFRYGLYASNDMCLDVVA
jgi:hypothetical protein